MNITFVKDNMGVVKKRSDNIRGKCIGNPLEKRLRMISLFLKKWTLVFVKLRRHRQGRRYGIFQISSAAAERDKIVVKVITVQKGKKLLKHPFES